jgi:hypothetical protein
MKKAEYISVQQVTALSDEVSRWWRIIIVPMMKNPTRQSLGKPKSEKKKW